MRLNLFFRWPSKNSPSRRVLRFIGPSWAAMPLRRLMQAAALLAFLVMLFWLGRPASYRSDAFVELFLAMDPLVGITATLAGRAWVWSLGWALAVLAIAVVIPRFFCAGICPLGTLIDLFDRLVNRPIRRLLSLGGVHVAFGPGPRFALLAIVLAASAGGVMLAGFVAAIPLLTRALQLAVAVPSDGLDAWRGIGLAVLAMVLLAGMFGRRFWCRNLCPSGALFSAFSPLRLTQRTVSQSCTQCGQCRRVCDFDAIGQTAGTIATNCSSCQTCGGVCPPEAISFCTRLPIAGSSRPADTILPPAPAYFSRRGFLLGLAGGTVAGGLAAAGLEFGATSAGRLLLRPPGSAHEAMFNRLCVRCGQCLGVCPTGVLQPAGGGEGIEKLWTPWLDADRAGCQADCNRCGQVCPTGAIAELTIERKRETVIGLAEIDPNRCLHFAGTGGCETGQHSADGTEALHCQLACPYEAIILDAASGTPMVMAELCIGCGFCQSACYHANVLKVSTLAMAAVSVAPGPGRERKPAVILDEPPASTEPEADPPYFFDDLP